MSLESVDRLAVCMDGTPAVYYWRPATNGSSRWVVNLEWGGWCWSEESCRWRCPPGSVNFLCSSAGYPATLGRGGLLRWAQTDGANVVHVKYCSSDGHMGDAEAFGLQFRGQRIVQAVLTDLVQRHGLGAGSEEHWLLFGGQSAGARGAMVHLDYLQVMLAEAGLSNPSSSVRVTGFLDSPLWVDMQPREGVGRVAAAEQCRGVFSNAKPQHLGSACVQAQPSEERWRCIMGEYRLPHVATPYFLIASQFDSFQLQNLLGKEPRDYDANDTAYAEELGHRTRDVLRSLDAAKSPQSAIFSWACYNHAESLSDALFDRGAAAGTTLYSALESFIAVDSVGAKAEEWIDTCKEFSCGAGCRPALE